MLCLGQRERVKREERRREIENGIFFSLLWTQMTMPHTAISNVSRYPIQYLPYGSALCTNVLALGTTLMGFFLWFAGTFFHQSQSTRTSMERFTVRQCSEDDVSFIRLVTSPTSEANPKTKKKKGTVYFNAAARTRWGAVDRRAWPRSLGED